MLPFLPLQGEPEPLETEIHEISGSKREHQLSDPFFDLVQNTSLVRFFVPDSPLQFLQGSAGHAKVPAKVPEDSRLLSLGVRRLWFPTSNRLDTWIIPSGTDRSRQYHEPTMVCPCTTS